MYEITGKTPYRHSWIILFAIVLLASSAIPASAQGTFFITNLSPSSAPVGSGDFTLTITLNAAPGDVGLDVTFNGTDVQILSADTPPNVLEVTVPGGLIMTPGTAPVVVTIINGEDEEPTPAANFTITGPQITSLQPVFALLNSGQVAMTINGSGFYTLSSSNFLSPNVLIGGQSLTSTLVSNTQLTVTIPTSITGTAQNYSVQVQDLTFNSSSNPQLFLSNQVPFPVVPPLAINTVQMAGAMANSPYDFTFVTSGGVPPLQFVISGLPTTLTYNPATGEVTGTPTAQGTFPVSVTVTDSVEETAFARYNLLVGPPVLHFTTSSLPVGLVGTGYLAAITASGGTPPYIFSLTPPIITASVTRRATSSGLPPGLTLASNGVISGTPNTTGTYNFTVYVTDSIGFTVSAGYSISIAIPALTFITTSLPSGVVGAQYVATIGATGGVPSYSFSVIGGSPPPGVSMGSNGFLIGTPTTAGTFNFTVQVNDSGGGTASALFSITIAVPPLTITTGTLPGAPAGTPLNIAFAANGGTPPYKWSSSSPLPPGTTFSSAGVLSGSPTTGGAYSFQVTVQDSAGAISSKSFSLTVVAPLITISNATIPNGQAGVPYSVQFFASGGQTPYTWSVSGGPAGVTMSATGLLSGTPTADGQFNVAVSVTDPNNDQTSALFTITIAPAPLVITTSTLPPGTAGIAYAATTLTATGGDPPYSWSAQGLPAGLTLSASGALSGTPSAAGTYAIPFTVTDSKKATTTAKIVLVIQTNAISITTTALPNGTVGSPYSFTVLSSGGVGSNKWAATNLPQGLTMSQSGALSGTPTTAGQFVTVVTVTDAAGTVGVQTFTLTILLPTTPPLNFSSLPSSGNPGTQTGVQVGLSTPYPVAITATLTLTFAPDSGADDPAVQFSTGGRSTAIQIPAGSTGLTGTVALQFGTVSGLITITADLLAAGQDITPTPPPTVTVRIAPSAPVISSVTAIRGSSGFAVTIIGFATPRQVTQALFTFSAQSSANLQTTSITVPVSSLFAAWYSSPAAGPFGSQFSFLQQFNVSGSLQGITSVTVTLTDPQGNSSAMTANLQ